MRVSLKLMPLMLAVATPLAAQWTNQVSKDEMTGTKQAFAHSAQMRSTQPMPFPYEDTKAWLGFGCDGQSEWVYVGFSQQPNIVNTEPQDGYSTFGTRLKWDNQVETMTFSQKWGDSFLNFQDDQKAMDKIAAAGTLLLELDWYGAGQVYFRFSLRGSTAAIDKARAACTK